RLEEAVLEAWGDRSKGGVSHACGHASVGHCRRVVYTDGVAEMYGDTTRPDFAGMEGGEDASFDVLFCFDENGKPTGAVVNIPCPSQVMEATYKVSSDYMGRLRELTQERFGESFRTLCQVAPAGDQSPRDLTRPGTTVPLWGPEGVEILANRLMRAIDAVYPDVERTIDYDAALSHAVSSLALPRRRASYQEYRAASETVDRLEAIQSLQDAYADFCEETHATETILNRPGPYDNKLCHFGEVMNNKAVIARYEDQDEQPNYEFELHVLRVGNVVFATNPFELFLEYGQRIRARSRAAGTFLVQLCGDCGGYLPTPRAEQLGGYGGLIVNGRVGPDGGALLVDATVDRINAIVSTDEGKA
ncbi:MAG: hypothetical protein HN904_29475, partial [Victivallales bacterium]|nr:hypothetical protein [Victivallales bacterium]